MFAHDGGKRRECAAMRVCVMPCNRTRHILVSAGSSGESTCPQHDTAGLDKHYSPRAPESIRDTPGNGYLREK